MRQRRLRALAALLLALVLLLQPAAAARPAPARGSTDGAAEGSDIGHSDATHNARTGDAMYSRRQLQLRSAGAAGSQLSSEAAERPSQEDSRRQLQMLRQQQPEASTTVLAARQSAGAPGPAPAEEEEATAADGVAAAETAQRQAEWVGQNVEYQLQEMLALMADRGMQLASEARQGAIVAALVAGVEQLARSLVAQTRDEVAVLRRDLREMAPGCLTEVAALLHDSRFQEQLRDVREDAMLAVGSALQPHLASLAQSVYSALSALVLPPDAMEPLAAFESAHIPALAATFTSSMVEATLLQALWHE